MRVVLAPNAFKGSLTAMEAAEAMAEGVRSVIPTADLVLVPIADGGDGTVEALVRAAGGTRRRRRVRGPLGEPVDAEYGVIDGGATAVIEMARAAGLVLLAPERRDPGLTTTFGVGQLLQDAWDSGVRRFIVGIGGSATNDGGAGCARAFGLRFLDRDGDELDPGGGPLALLDRIDAS
ncbi:MAG: glycerate kinase, partial [Candidatus Dormibacter sp.]